MNMEKKFRRWGLKQCAEEIKVSGADLSFFCVLKYGHKGRHSIHLRKEEIKSIAEDIRQLIDDQKKGREKRKNAKL